MERIKLIWDFRGPNAAQTAKHHVVHLEEFVVSEKIEETECSTQVVSPMYVMAVMVVPKRHLEELRNKLKPHRGQLHKE